MRQRVAWSGQRAPRISRALDARNWSATGAGDVSSTTPRRLWRLSTRCGDAAYKEHRSKGWRSVIAGPAAQHTKAGPVVPPSRWGTTGPAAVSRPVIVGRSAALDDLLGRCGDALTGDVEVLKEPLDGSGRRERVGHPDETQQGGTARGQKHGDRS